MKIINFMDELNKLLTLPEKEKFERGLLYTPQEISQQPETWRKTFLKFREREKEIAEFLDDRAGLGAGSAAAASRPTIFLVGAGTSDYIGRSLTSLLKQKWLCEAEAVPSTDLLTEMDELILADRKYLWISFSRSGDSSEGVAALRAALDKYPQQISHFIITCNKNGSMARDFTGYEQVFCLTLDEEVNDRGLAMTSSFSNMVVAGQCLANYRELPDFEETVRIFSEAARSFLASATTSAFRASGEGFTKVCFLGTGAALRSVAIESALKVLELTAGRIYAFSESFLGLRHGPLSAIDGKTLVAGFLSGDARRQSYELDLLRDIRRKNLAGKILTVSSTDPGGGGGGEAAQTGDIQLIADFERRLPDVYKVPVYIIFGQLLGLFCSLEHGLKPDSPSPNGAITRVVESLKVY